MSGDREDPSMYGAKPVHGNYTDTASLHLRCAHALSILLATPEEPIQNLHDDIQQALRHLQMSELGRALKAQAAGHD